jgi:hypothetical protein
VASLGEGQFTTSSLIAEASPVCLTSTAFRATVVTAGTRIESPSSTTTVAGKKVVQ